MRLETKRLVLRAPKKSDVKSIREHIDSLNISRYMSMIPYPYSDEDAVWWINKCSGNRKKKPRTDYQFVITIKPSDKVVGGVGLVRINKEGVGEIGYWIGEKYWRNGYVFEGVMNVIDYAFNDLKLKKIAISASVENVGSNALIKKLGLRFVEMKKKAMTMKSTGKIHNKNIYEISRDEGVRDEA